MTHGILLALTEDEADVVRAVDAPGTGARVVRRCADLAELLAGVGAGIGSVAVLSSQMLGVDRASVARLVAAGAKVLLVGPSGDVARLGQLGAHATATESERPATIAAMAIALARGEQVELPPPAQRSASSPHSMPTASPRSRAGRPAPGEGQVARRSRRELHRPAGAPGGGTSAADEAAEVTDDRSGVDEPPVGRSADDVTSAPYPAPGPVPPAEDRAGDPPPTRTTPADPAVPRTAGEHPEALPVAGTADRNDDGNGDADDVITAVPWWLSAGRAGAAADHAPPDLTTDRSGPSNGDPGTGLVEAVSEPEPAAAEEDGPGRIVVVWGPRGAPGRTTIALNIAAEAAVLGVRTVLVDADTEAPSLTQVLGLSDDISSIAAATRMATHGRLDADAARGALTPVADGLYVLTGLTRPDRWRELEETSLDAVWEVLREVAPLVVVDVAAGAEEGDGGDFSPSRHQATLSALAAADELVVVGLGDPVGIRRLVLALTDLRERGLASTARRSVVVNRVRRAAAGPDPGTAVREALWRYASDQEPHLLPDDPATADGAVLAGETWFEHAPGTPARRSVELLTRHLLGVAAGAGSRRRWWRRAARTTAAGRG